MLCAASYVFLAGWGSPDLLAGAGINVINDIKRASVYSDRVGDVQGGTAATSADDLSYAMAGLEGGKKRRQPRPQDTGPDMAAWRRESDSLTPDTVAWFRRGRRKAGLPAVTDKSADVISRLHEKARAISALPWGEVTRRLAEYPAKVDRKLGFSAAFAAIASPITANLRRSLSRLAALASLNWRSRRAIFIIQRHVYGRPRPWLSFVLFAIAGALHSPKNARVITPYRAISQGAEFACV